MIIVAQIVTAFVLPPGCIILGLLLITVFVPRWCKWVPLLLAALLYFLSVEPGANILLRPLEDAYPPLSLNAENNESYKAIEAIVVLGGGTVQNSPEVGAVGDSLSADAMKRTVYAFSLRNSFNVPYVFSGGIVLDYGQETEAAAAERVFNSLGLPSRRLILETESRNTWENAKEMTKRGYKQVMLVTSAYHMRRSVFCFEHNGITVIPAPADYKCNRGRDYNFFSYIPAMVSLEKSYIALHEYVGLFSYRLLYRLRFLKTPCEERPLDTLSLNP